MTEADFKALAERRHFALEKVLTTKHYGAYQDARDAFNVTNDEYHNAIRDRAASSQQKACEK